MLNHAQPLHLKATIAFFPFPSHFFQLIFGNKRKKSGKNGKMCEILPTVTVFPLIKSFSLSTSQNSNKKWFNFIPKFLWFRRNLLINSIDTHKPHPHINYTVNNSQRQHQEVLITIIKLNIINIPRKTVPSIRLRTRPGRIFFDDLLTAMNWVTRKEEVKKNLIFRQTCVCKKDLSFLSHVLRKRN